jgi:AraC-like DNA-binding protein
MSTLPKERATIPASHALDLADLVQELGGSSVRLLASAGLDRSQLEPPSAVLGLTQMQTLVAQAIAQTGQPWIGVLLGLRMRVPAHGFLGFAAMTAPTVREALDLVVRYAPIRSDVLRISYEVQGAECTVYLDEQVDLEEARDTLLIALVTGIWCIGEALTGQKLTGRAEFTFPAPAYAALALQTPLRVHQIAYARPRNLMRFDSSYLDLPFAMAHASAFQLAKEQCELALAALDRAGLERQVREALPREGGGVCTVDEVALRLGTSSRTLQRKLKAEGISFSDIADALQEQQARALLRDDRLSLEQVAERLGYSDVSNFTRAFRRWTGETPAAWRRLVNRA